MKQRKSSQKLSRPAMDFTNLVDAIHGIHDQCAAQANRAVNVSLTLRNWMIGYYIHQYELKGMDRAKYGDRLIDALSESLATLNVSRCDRRELYRYRLFCRIYPQIVEAAPPQLALVAQNYASRQPLIAKSPSEELQPTIWESTTPQLTLTGRELLEKFSFTHLAELIEIDDPLKRAFYEIECIQGNWSVRALKRQIASLYYERSGLSINKEKLSAIANDGAEKAGLRLNIRDPYIFEFLGLKPKEAVSESDLEDALLDNLQDFLLELGNGFCFEARQKSITIGKTRGFVDLVFYHRILRCHVLIELKADKFTHEHIGQLNTYVTWYRKHVMAKGDNPPVGLLLCAGKDHTLAEYALAGMDNRLFVSKYQLELPAKEDLQRFLEDKRREMGDDA